MRSPARIAIAFASSLLVLAVIVAWSRGGLPLATGVGPASVPSQQTPSLVASAEEAFRAGFAPLLARAGADAAALVATGEARDRKLLRVRDRQSAMLASIAVADAWLAANPVPTRFAPVIAAYRDGAAAIGAAMSEGQAGFLRFDFDRVARATFILKEGEAALELAARLLHVQGSAPATPLPETT